MALPEPSDRKAREIALWKIQQLMDFWRISVDELEGELPATPAPAPRIKYRHPVTGDTWDGQGEHPDWLRRALLKEGYTVAELRPADVLFVRDADSPQPS